MTMRASVRWSGIVVGLLLLSLATPAPAQAQGRKGGGKGGNTSTCDATEYDAWLEFDSHPLTGESPSMHPSDDADARLFATVANGRISGSFDVDNESGSPWPLRLHFEGGGEYPPGSLDHYGAAGPVTVDVDPRLVSYVYTDEATLTPLECELFGMRQGALHVGRIGVMWWEQDGDPVERGADSDGRWVLRYKPFDSFDNPPTFLHARRVSGNEWAMWSRTDSTPPHHASLEKTGSGNGRKAIPTTWSKPLMPVAIRITVDCGGPCPEPEPTDG